MHELIVFDKEDEKTFVGKFTKKRVAQDIGRDFKKRGLAKKYRVKKVKKKRPSPKG